MSKIWSFMIIISIIIAVAFGNPSKITDVVMKSSTESIENILKMLGMTCFWSGIFNILRHTSLIKRISQGLGVVIKKLFNKQDVSDKAVENISLNVTCDFLGVGNAATVYGLKAIEALNEANENKDKASDNMILFAVLNSASIQLIPTGMITLRAMYNSQNPVEIVPYVWLVTIVALTVGLISCKILNKIIK